MQGQSHDSPRTVWIPVSLDNNEQRIGRCLGFLSDGLRVFIGKLLLKVYGERAISVAYQTVNLTMKVNSTINDLEIRYLLLIITKLWNEVFSLHSNLDHFHRNLAHELRQVINSPLILSNYSHLDTK